MLDEAQTAYLDAIARGDQGETDRLAAVLDVATTLEQQRRTEPDLPAEALNLALLGIPVFPLQAGGKHPLIAAAHGKDDPERGTCRGECGRHGHGLYDATTDPAVIREWWSRAPRANIGIRTGIVFDVVDIDGLHGHATLYNGPTPIIDSLDVLGIAHTPRDGAPSGQPGGGRHLYVPVSGRGNKTGLMPGVDYRGDGGYVVAPPSVGRKGNDYEWVRHPMLEVATAAA